jgi:predicted deacylase
MKVELFQTECELIDELDVESLAPGIHRLALRLTQDGAGRPCHIPVLVAKGAASSPIFGVTAAIHGNELNGVRVVQRVFADLDPANVRGVVVGCPILNLPGYLSNQRYLGHEDLNRLMPGKPNGSPGQVYSYRLMTRLIDRFSYLVDLHTASFGRVNALYVRVNLTDPNAARMAQLISPEIIVHNDSDDGTLRRAAMKLGMPAITVEVGNPLRFQARMITNSLLGVRRVMADLGIVPGHVDPPKSQPVICSRSRWIHAEHGGLLDVFPDVTDFVSAGQVVARVSNVFGQTIAEYKSESDGIVIGRSSNPVCQTGSRILHVGTISTRDVST